MRKHLGLLLVLALAAFPATGFGQAHSAPAAEEFRGALRNQDSQRLEQAAAGLLTLPDLAEVLLLAEWRPFLREEVSLEASVRPFAARAAEVHGELFDRFTVAVQAALQDSEQPLRQQAVLGFLATIARESREAPGQDPLWSQQNLSGLTPDLIRLIRARRRAGDPVGLRATAVLGQVQPPDGPLLDEAVGTLAEQLRPGHSPDERRAAALAMHNLVADAVQLLAVGEDAQRLHLAVWRTAEKLVPVVSAERLRAEPDPAVRQLLVAVLATAAAPPPLRDPARTLRQYADELAGLEQRQRAALPGQEAALVAQLDRSRERLEGLALQYGRLIGVVRTQATVAALRQAASDPDPAVRVLGLAAVQRLAAVLAGPPDATPNSAEVVPVVAHERLFSPSEALEQDVRKELAGLRDRLAGSLADPQVRVQRTALDALEELGPLAAPVSPEIARALSAPDRFVRWSAARILRKLAAAQPGADLHGVPELARALARETDADLQQEMVLALERYGPRAAPAAPVLARLLAQNGDVELRRSAMAALAAIGAGSSRAFAEGAFAEQALPALARALRDPNYRVRLAAAEAFGRFGPRAAAFAGDLDRALEDVHPDVRRAANQALLRVLSHPLPG
jgi:HEAT repeat protein